MSNVINKETGQYRESVNTPDYIQNKDFIINPTAAEIEQYKYVPPELSESEKAIQELSIIDFEMVDNLLDNVINGVQITQKSKDSFLLRKNLRAKI